MDTVLCLVKESWFEPDLDSQEAWMDLVPNATFPRKIEYILPLYDHPHSDKENGQNEIHYHIDGRYIENYPEDFRISLPLSNNEKFEYRYLKRIRENEPFKTNVSLISKSKLKHKCIHKGKCPHRGYDLSNEKPDENGIITCPLHGLKFDINNKVINHE